MYDALYKHSMDTQTLSTANNHWVDVRDVAKAHMLAAKTPGAGGERFIVNFGKFYWQDIGAHSLSLHSQFGGGC